MRKLIASVSLGAVLTLFALSAKGSPADYGDAKAEMGIGKPVHGIEVSKNRFVVMLNRNAEHLYFVDSWNWRLLNPAGADTVQLNGSVSSMDLNYSGGRVYFAYQSGAVKWMDIDPLFSLGFNQALNPADIHIEPGATVASGSTVLGQIVALQDSDSASMDCVFVELIHNGTSSLAWLLVSENSVEEYGFITDSAGRNFEMAKSRKRLFVKSEDALGYSRLFAYRCFSNQLANNIVSDDLEINAFYAYQGLGANSNGQVLIVGNQDLAELWSYEVTEGIAGNLIALPATAYDRLSAIPAGRIWINKISAETDTFVFFTQANTLMLSSLNKNTAEFKAEDPHLIKNFSAGQLLMASSSSRDGYLYASPEGADTVSIITANPIISNLSLARGGTVTTETFKIKFNTDVTNSFYTVAECPNFAISPSGCGATLATGELKGTTAEVFINSRDLGDGTHILGVFVRDRYSAPYHQGRNALRVKIDLPPPPQEFEMGFGDQKIFIKFHSPDLKDLKKYVIYYGTNCNAGFYKPGEIDKTGGNGDPASPIEIKDPEPDKDYEKVVEKLNNGTQYCAQVVLIDTAGNKSYSERNYATPEQTKGPSDEAGEKGGLDCLGDISSKPKHASASEMLLLILPLIIVMILKIRLRSKI